MAELLAIGKDLKGLSLASTLNADGTAVLKLAGDGYKPELRLTKAEVAAVVATLGAKPVEPPAPPPPSGFTAGLVLNSDAQLPAALSPKLLRVEFGIGEGTRNLETVAASYARAGAQLQPLAGFANRIPSAQEAKGLAAWAKAGPFDNIEFGNETSYSYQLGGKAGGEYAVRFREAAEVLTPLGVGLLCQADDGNSGSSEWVDKMFAAVPDLLNHVAGWVIHPYLTSGGVGKLERMISQLANHGDTNIPIMVTEFGIPTDNGRTLSDGTHYTYSEAGGLLESTLKAFETVAKGRLRSLLVYQAKDQQSSGSTTNREAYFGALTSSQQPKGSFTTAVKTLLA